MDTAIRQVALTAPRLVPARPSWLLFSVNLIGLVGLLVALFTVHTGTSTTHAGEVAGDTVVAQGNLTYVDRVATAAKQKQAMEAVPPVYRRDLSEAEQRRREAAGFLTRAAPVLASSRPAAAKLAAIRSLLPGDISLATLEQFPSLSPADFKVVQQQSLSLLSQAINLRFDSNQVTTTEFGLLPTIPSRVTVSQRTAIGEILTTFLAPTILPNWTATQSLRKQAAAAVTPVTNTIYSGEVIVRRGDMVTPAIMEKLVALGLQNHQSDWQDVVASLLFSVVVITMLFWYLHAFQAVVLTNPRLLLLVDASVLVTVGAARLLTTGHVLLPFFLPVAAASTFAAALIAPEACIALTLTMAVLAGWIVANSFELTMYYFLSGSAGVLAIRQLRHLKQFVLAGCFIAIFALLTELAFGLIDHSYDLAALQEHALAAIANGFLSSTLALGGFALLSDFFGVTTTLRLLELGQPNQPLLRRLTSRAPGTYNHSVIVATMVERAAEEIGARSLVAKLGALYHDVGKTANPHCFVENQLGIGNVHDELRATESARIIRGHVSQGIRLAKQFKLPRVIVDAIAEHHGTMSISYFLHKARAEKSEVPIDLSLFTYPGPKPQSKETALLMLADGSESAVRAASEHSGEQIRAVVQRIIADRIQHGQLDECPLTLHDLELARTAFCAVLNGLYHPRIEYPETSDRPNEPSALSPQPSALSFDEGRDTIGGVG